VIAEGTDRGRWKTTPTSMPRTFFYKRILNRCGPSRSLGLEFLRCSKEMCFKLGSRIAKQQPPGLGVWLAGPHRIFHLHKIAYGPKLPPLRTETDSFWNSFPSGCDSPLHLKRSHRFGLKTATNVQGIRHNSGEQQTSGRRNSSSEHPSRPDVLPEHCRGQKSSELMQQGRDETGIADEN